jgi:membrane protease subunit HflC
MSVGFTHVGLASGVLESVFEKMKSDRSRLANQLQSEGESIAEKIKAEAQTKYDQAIATIAGNVKTILAQAEADSIEAYKTMAKHPDLALKLKKIESLEALLKDRATLILDRNTMPMDILYSTSR